MPINAHPDYLAAEKEYSEASTKEDKILTLKKMISLAPAHKSAEKLRKMLTLRKKKLEKEFSKKTKFKKEGIKKGEMQAVLIGKTNSGKSSILNLLTNSNTNVKETRFTTKKPILGIMNYMDIQIQLIENPAISSEEYHKGLTNGADVLLFLITSLEDLKFLKEKKFKNLIILFNKSDILNEAERRKVSANLRSKKFKFFLTSKKEENWILEFKKELFREFKKIRIYTKEPKKKKSKNPIVIKESSSVKDIAKKLFRNLKEIEEVKLWGPSSKFQGQKVKLTHQLKDSDTLEFKIKKHQNQS